MKYIKRLIILGIVIAVAFLCYILYLVFQEETTEIDYETPMQAAYSLSKNYKMAIILNE